MSISLSKTSHQATLSQTASGGAVGGDPVEALRQRVVQRVVEAYCDSALRFELIRYGVNDLALDSSTAGHVTDMELDSLGCANETKLLEELDGLLRRFTDNDKKLDQKECADAIQIVCRPKSGYSKGLVFDTAERRVVEFCRANRVKVKVGFLRWEIP